jgi:hypothetical protein
MVSRWKKEFLVAKINVVSRSSEIQLEVGGKAGTLTLGKLDVDVRNAFKEVSMGRTLETISSG